MPESYVKQLIIKCVKFYVEDFLLIDSLYLSIDSLLLVYIRFYI